MNNLRCPQCGLSHIKRNGYTHYGKQNYRCKGFWCNFSSEGRLSLFQLLPTRQALLPIPAGSWHLGR
jgi:transposase-like protein